jgi:N6-L-threonylcarbamoyladenine synthase
MKILGIESSCDETAVSVVEGKKILSNVVASQNEIHSKYGGIVPELASRQHVEAIVPLLAEAIESSGVKLKELDGIAVTRSPGLIGALLVGLSTAKAMAYSLGLPFIGVNHLEGHINAAHLSESEIPYPHIGLIVSGGHTSLYLVKSFGHYQLLGATRDDAAGEAFDKVARLLNLGYPGGPLIDKLAPKGDPDAIKLKQPRFSNCAEFDFSFSGVKTAIMLEYKRLKENGEIAERDVLNLVASFQKTIVDSLVNNICEAAKKYYCTNVVVSGGVAANSALRTRLKSVEAKENLTTFIPPMSLCTDNAAMIAYVGAKRLEMGERDDLDLNAVAVEEIGI